MKKGTKTVMILIVVVAIVVAIYLWYSQYVAQVKADDATAGLDNSMYDGDDVMFDNADAYGFGF